MPGLLLGLFGVGMAARWMFQVDAITRLIPGSEHVGIVSPLLFIAAGISLFMASRPQDTAAWRTRLSAVCIAALIGLPLGYLFESATGIGLGIDVVRAGTAPTTTDPYPGRLSLNASVALLLAGSAFWLYGRRPARAGRLVFMVLALAVSFIGLGGLVGHFVGLEVLYRVDGFNRMLPPTAFGLSLVGAGLWMLHEASQAFDPKALHKSEQRIKRRSIAIITLVALAGGVAGFAVMRDTFERSVSKDMLLTATTNATSLAHTIEVALWLPRTVASRPAARQALDKLSGAPDDALAKDFLQKVADSFLSADLTGIEIYAANGARVAQAGTVAPTAALVIQRLANTGQTTLLAWKGGYILFAETDILIDGRAVGRVLTEQRMPLFDHLLADIRASSETSDVAICGRENDKAICAPNRFRPWGFETPLFDATGRPGLPVARALLGERGVQFLKDRRGTNVLSAFTPIKDSGLGLAVRTDVDTLYAPLQSRLNILVLALGGIVALAIYAQHSHVRPVLKQLIASEQTVKAILDDQSELVSLVKPDGELIYVNPAYARYFALTPAEMIGRNLFDYVEPAQRAIVRQVVADVLSTGKTAAGESRLTAADGAERWIAWTDSLQRDPAGKPMLHSVGRDVTERKQAERALRSSQALLARMGRVAGVGGWEIDLLSGTHTWTEETRRIHEVGPDFVPTLEAGVAFFPPASRPLIEAAVRQASEHGEPWSLEVPLVTATGRHIWVRSQGEAETRDGKPVRLVGAIQDITGRMLAERALRTLTAIFEATTDYVVQNDAQGRITYMNPAARLRTGVALDSSVEHLTLADLNPPQTLQKFISEVRPHTAAAGVWVGESMVWDAERREFPVSHIVICHRDKQGRIEYFSALMRDISVGKAAERSHREAQQALLESEARLRTVADSLPMRVAYVDADERYRFNNLAYERAFGRPRDDLCGQTMRAVMGEAAYASAEPHIRSALRGESVTFLLENASGGSYVCHEAHYIPQFAGDGGTVLGFHVVVSDITRQKLEERRLVELARVDPLTGVINRAGFESHVAEAMQRCRGTGALMALMYLDIDRFKQVNDRYGHSTGDALLRAFASRLSQTLRSTDTVARLGGDEFTVIMEGLPRPEVAATVGDKIIQAMSKPFFIEQQAIDITTSIGLAFYRGDATTVEALVKQADVMLYQAKSAGRNNVQVALRLIEGGRV